MDKLNINLIWTEEELKEEYQKYVESYKKDGLEKHIKEFSEWRKETYGLSLSTYGQQRVVNKIDELIEVVNKIQPLVDLLAVAKSEGTLDELLKTIKGQ